MKRTNIGNVPANKFVGAQKDLSDKMSGENHGISWEGYMKFLHLSKAQQRLFEKGLNPFERKIFLKHLGETSFKPRKVNKDVFFNERGEIVELRLHSGFMEFFYPLLGKEIIYTGELITGFEISEGADEYEIVKEGGAGLIQEPSKIAGQIMALILSDVARENKPLPRTKHYSSNIFFFTREGKTFCIYIRLKEVDSWEIDCYKANDDVYQGGGSLVLTAVW